MPAINTGRLYMPSISQSNINGTSLVFAATTDVISLIHEIPQTGNITGMKFTTGTVGTGCTLVCTIETVSASKPTGTLYHANATATVVVANLDDNVVKTVAFSSFAATRGDLVAITIRYSSGAPSNLQIRTSSALVPNAYPTQYSNIATVDAWVAGQPHFILTYDTGDVNPESTLAWTNSSNISISSSTTPDEAGNLFTAPYSGVSDGFLFRVANNPNAQDIDVVLYDSADNVVASKSLSATALSGGTLTNNDKGFWTTDVNIVKGQQYRLVAKPTTTTTWTNLFTQINGVVLGGNDGDANPQYTTRTDAGAWSNTANALVPICLMIKQVYQPGGSFL